MATPQEINFINLAAALVQNTEKQEIEAKKKEEARKEEARILKEKEEQKEKQRIENNEKVGLEVANVIHKKLLGVDKTGDWPGLIVYVRTYRAIEITSSTFTFKSYDPGAISSFDILTNWRDAVYEWIKNYLKGTDGMFGVRMDMRESDGEYGSDKWWELTIFRNKSE